GIILAVFKQPGANVIDTVDQIKAELPQLTARIPPAIKVETILDRTTTIRASVHDVQFTLALTIPLLLLLLLLFLPTFCPTQLPRARRGAGPGGGVSLFLLTPRYFAVEAPPHRVWLHRRRRHRGGGEHPPPHRGRRRAVRGHAQGLARDRLHRAVDQPVAGGG